MRPQSDMLSCRRICEMYRAFRVRNRNWRYVMPDQKNTEQLVALLRQQMPLLSERYRVRSLKMFGSYVRHEQRPDSDLDLLVTFDELPSLLKFIELENYLTDTLGVKVDLVMPDTLKPRIGQRILSEVVPV
jgi:predicted nucleotidyltransferase